MRVTSKQYGADNVTVTVEWAQQVGAMYDVRTSPSVLIMHTEGTSRLTVSYNIGYNLSVVTATPCGNTTAFIELKYGEMYKI